MVSVYGDGVFSNARADCLSLGRGLGGIVGDRTPLQILTGKPGRRSCWDDEDEGMFTKAKGKLSQRSVRISLVLRT